MSSRPHPKSGRPMHGSLQSFDLGAEVARALSDDKVREIALGCARLPLREKGIVLGIVRQFAAMGATERSEQATPPAGPP